MAPAGEMKIVLIEHLERATLGAANALLKSLEEPLPGRCIIASVHNKDMILPTIASRALLIHCDAPYDGPKFEGEQHETIQEWIDAIGQEDMTTISKQCTKIAKQ